MTPQYQLLYKSTFLHRSGLLEEALEFSHKRTLWVKVWLEIEAEDLAIVFS